MALNSLFCADVPLSNYSLTHSPTSSHSFHPVAFLTACPTWTATDSQELLSLIFCDVVPYATITYYTTTAAGQLSFTETSVLLLLS